TVERYAGYLVTLLEAMAGDETCAIDRLPILGSEERERILRWSGEEAEFPSETCLHELFEAQAERTPEAVAVVEASGRSVTYAELNARANRLARRLRAMGVGPDRLVGLRSGRSLEMVCGLLAVLKAGGAYVPLDPSYPSERLAMMIEDCRPVVVLSEPEDFEAGGYAETNLDRNGLHSDNLAYVIYTSGSTGKPKGARATHRGVMNLVHWYRHELSIGADDKVLIPTSPSFDLTQRNLLSPLFGGGELHLAAEPFDPEAIAQQIATSGITMMNLTSTAFHALMGVSRDGELSGLRVVVLGGEATQ